MQIRAETPADIPAVWQVEAAAFGRPEEANLVDLLRRENQLVLSLVVEQDGQIIGHIAFSEVRLEPSQEPVRWLGLGPIAVHPDQQGRGVGSALIHSGLEAAREMGYTAVVLLGSRVYYPRFGFRPAVNWTLDCQFPSPPENFMAFELVPGALEGNQGTVYYQPAFETVE